MITEIFLKSIFSQLIFPFNECTQGIITRAEWSHLASLSHILKENRKKKKVIK